MLFLAHIHRRFWAICCRNCLFGFCIACAARFWLRTIILAFFAALILGVCLLIFLGFFGCCNRFCFFLLVVINIHIRDRALLKIRPMPCVRITGSIFHLPFSPTTDHMYPIVHLFFAEHQAIFGCITIYNC